MRRIAAIFSMILCLAAVGPAFAQTATGWANVESKTGGFKAAFPSEPEESVKDVEDPTGKRRIYWYKVLKNHYYFAVNYSDYPVPPIKKEALTEAYDLLERQVAQIFGGKLIARREISVGGVEGREITFEKFEERQIVRHFIVGNRIYWNLVVMREADYARSEMASMAAKFFDSFEISKIDKK